ncbi:hypothetical protein EJ02DRAFT_350815 [Clathrospora elynae]|uniref:Apple domain-containing protein n=1 Tax=Clathrospora elynae TaxID=706981 RepID=A0A6A5SHG9_9PLEO|nr:hypothetical protein EJ02DRAFT_350815 [Clathrospora elynae]
MDNQKFPYYAPEPPILAQNAYDTHKIVYETTVDAQEQRQTICGLRKKTSWILIIVAIVVVAAAVGGGVGGALASRSLRSSDNASSTAPQPSDARASAKDASTSTTPSRTSSTPTKSVATTPIVGPTSTIQRDCPSSNDTLYSATFGSSVMQFRKACSISFLNANGVGKSFGKITTSLDDCINLCAVFNVKNATEISQGTSTICNSVCWRNTFDKVNDSTGGQCFGFMTVNTTDPANGGGSLFRYKMPAETVCDSAALINQVY